MTYIKHTIRENGSIEVKELKNGDPHRYIVQPNQHVEKYKDQIEADPDYSKYRTQENDDTYQAQLQADEPSEQEIAQRRSEQAESEGRKIIMERLIEKELEADTDMKSLIEQAKTKDNPGQFIRDEIQKSKTDKL